MIKQFSHEHFHNTCPNCGEVTTCKCDVEDRKTTHNNCDICKSKGIIAMPGKIKQVSTVTRINALLKSAGRQEKLVKGRGYYYLIDGDAAGFPYTSMYVYRLDPTPQDFRYALDWLQEVFNDAYRSGAVKQPIDFKKFL